MGRLQPGNRHATKCSFGMSHHQANSATHLIVAHEWALARDPLAFVGWKQRWNWELEASRPTSSLARVGV